ncbi:MAG TPA: sugar nucleotide-binding protein, partial [Sedimentisphaerales bacterium]|nr:sugar nucleotide-binding protein [Sedimentisphaerales bacterium]
MANVKIALLGGRGMLGTDVAELFLKNKLDVTVFDLPNWDICACADIKKAVESADIIINCAAYTNVDLAESQSELAYKINADAVASLSETVRENNKYLIHISTDFVFDGRGCEPYSETDVPNPIN